MKEYLSNLSQILNEIDNNPVRSLQFFTTPMTTTNITNKPKDDCRYILIVDIIRNLIHSFTQLQNEDDVQKNLDQILYNINSKFQHNQQLCWPSHIHHFHSTFEDYVNCPVTCLFELSEFISKLNKECYVQ